MKKAIIITIIVLAILGLGFYLFNESTKPVVTNDLASVPDDLALKNNMQKAGLDILSAEGTTLHIHQHIDIVINGKPVTIPAHIGVGSTFISPLHIHDDSGILHVESPVQKDFKLGQFFDEWGVVLNDNCVGTYCADANHKLLVAANGGIINNVHDYVLKPHDEIEIWYGPKSENPTFISSYTFGNGM